MTAVRTARARARAELTSEIKAAARRQVAEVGAAQLSLRAVARELGMVSSALYRYFATRDELLTALIVDSYLALADALQRAGSRTGDDHAARWVARCRALRTWARQHPQEYALLYGSPVPDYRAPSQTIEPAAAVFLAFLQVVVDAHAAGALHLPEGDAGRSGRAIELPAGLLEQARSTGAEFAPDLPPALVVELFQALSTLFGAISLELFGHLVGSMDPADAFFDHTARETARLVRLVDPRSARAGS